MKLSLFILCFVVFACNKKSASVGSGLISDPAPGPDPLAKYQWHLSDMSIAYLNGESSTSGSNINLGTVHDTYTGDGVYVVVSDGRIDLNHPELKGNADLSLSKDYSLPSPFIGSPTTSDNTDGHGTGTSSLVAGVKGNGLGGYGVAYNATLTGTNFIASAQSASAMLDQATLSGHSGVFNYSYGYPTCEVATYSPYVYPPVLKNGVIEQGHIYVTAAGNDFIDSLGNCGGDENTAYMGNANFDQIKTYPQMIVVASSNHLREAASYSTPGSNVWVSAPGGDVDMGILVADLVGCSKGFNNYSPLSFDRTSSGLNPNCEFFSAAMGTSYASPITTGAIAVLREANPNLDWRDVKHILAKTATKIDPTAGVTTHPYNQNLAGHDYQQGWVTNNASYPFHPWYGFGQVNLSAAVALAETPNFDMYELKSTDGFDELPKYTSGNINIAIPDNSAAGASHSINVNGHNLFVEHVQITFYTSHNYSKQLGVELTSPAGTKTKLMNINSNMMGANSITLGANAFYGERSAGNWTIKVIDGASGNTGNLSNWSISIIGNQGAALADTTDPSPASAFSYAAGSLTWTGSPSGDVARYEICIALTSQLATSCGDGDWRHVKGVTSLFISGGKRIHRGQSISLSSGSSYTAKIRAVDTSENESSVVTTTSWTY